MIEQAHASREHAVAAIEDGQKQSRENQRAIGVVALSVINIHELWYGVSYEAGDRVMAEVLKTVRASVRSSDTPVQTSDSAVLIILPNLAHEAQLTMAVNKLIDAFQAPVVIDSMTIYPNVRLGAAFDAEHELGGLDLLARASQATQKAEKQGRPYLIYQEDLDEETGWEIETALRNALQAGELELYFQPKISLREDRPTSCEALVRWHSAERGFIPPDVFIPIAEQSGLIEPLTRSVINLALQHLSSWKSHGVDVNVAVNISPQILRTPRFVDQLSQSLQFWNVEPTDLTLEITETVAMEMPAVTNAVLREARALGYRIAIDDFGTGYSSLSYLAELPADEIKIDKSFVGTMHQNAANHQIVAAIIDLAKRFGFSVVAEGVESMKIVQELQKLKCDCVQGYYYSPAIPGPDFLDFIMNYGRHSEAS